MKERYTYIKCMLLIAMVLFTLSLTSCDTDSMKPNTSGTVTLHVSFTAKEGKTTRALSGNEDKVNDITVLVFNSSNDLIGIGYETFTGNTYSMDVTTHVDNNCTVYAIANTHSSSYFKGINTIDELNAMNVTQTSAASLGADSNDIMMSGEQTGVNITTSGSNLNPIAMAHLCSKINFSIVPKTGSGITVTGYQLCEVPLSSYVTDSHTAVTASPNGNYGSFEAVTLSSPTAEATVTTSTPYYVYENLAGNGNASSTSETSRTQSNAPSNGYATYLLVYAKTSSWHSTYRIYLGGVNQAGTAPVYADYNIYRNMNYTYTIDINGSGQSDARVTYTADGPVPVTPGIYYFSDGTWGTLEAHANATVKPIGIVFSNTTSANDKTHGWTHGYAMALTNANTSCTWGPTYTTENNVDVLKDGKVNYTYQWYNNEIYTSFITDKDGYCETHAISSTRTSSSSNYPAFYYALNYSVTAPSGSSGWYLPSIGQWWDILTNLGSMSTTVTNNGAGWCRWYEHDTNGGGKDYPALCANSINTLLTAITTFATNHGYSYGTFDTFSNNNEFYWSSSEYSSSNAGRVDFLDITHLGLDNDNKSNTFRVRVVVAF